METEKKWRSSTDTKMSAATMPTKIAARSSMPSMKRSMGPRAREAAAGAASPMRHLDRMLHGRCASFEAPPGPSPGVAPQDEELGGRPKGRDDLGQSNII